MRSDVLWAIRWLRRDPFPQPSPYRSAGRLMRVEEGSTSRTMSGVPVKEYQRWARRSDLLKMTAPYVRDTITPTGGGEPEQAVAVRCLRLFPLLGVPASLGRTCT